MTDRSPLTHFILTVTARQIVQRPVRLPFDSHSLNAAPTRRFTTSSSRSSGYGYRDKKSSSQPEGPAKEKLRLVPFRMNAAQAEEVSQHILLYIKKKKEKKKQLAHSWLLL